nr:MAG TPA: hypothetical protein [Caudoviricetes sp.]
MAACQNGGNHPLPLALPCLVILSYFLTHALRLHWNGLLRRGSGRCGWFHESHNLFFFLCMVLLMARSVYRNKWLRGGPDACRTDKPCGAGAVSP